MPHLDRILIPSAPLGLRRSGSPLLIAAALALACGVDGASDEVATDTESTGVDASSTGLTSPISTVTSDGAYTSAGETDTAGETDADEVPAAIPFDDLECPTGSAVTLVVPGAAELVADGDVGLVFRTDVEVAAVQAWLSSDDGLSYPHFIAELAVAGEGTHAATWDATASQEAIAAAVGDAAATGYRIALAAFDGDGALVGCSAGPQSFEIRGAPADRERVWELDFADPVLAQEVAAQTTAGQDAIAVPYLSFSDAAIADLDGLAHFPRLESLGLSGTLVGDLAELAWMTRLQILHLQGINAATLNFSHLAALTALEWLRINDNPLSAAKVRSLPPLPALRVLEMRATEMTSARVAELAAFPALETLDLGANAITEAAKIPFYASLTELTLDHNALASAAGLRHYPHLEVLNLADNALATPAGIPALPELRALYLQNNHLFSLTGLPAAPGLRTLLLGGNELKSLAGMPSYPALEELSLAGNHLTDVTALGELASLRTLRLDDNNLQHGVKVLAYLENLHTLDLRDNPKIPCIDQEFVASYLHAYNPGSTIYLSKECVSN